MHFQYLKEKYNIISLQNFIKAHKENKVKFTLYRKLFLNINLQEGKQWFHF